jgi:hypothetical protein
MEGSGASPPGGGGPENEDDGYSIGQYIRWFAALAVAIGGAVYMLVGGAEETLCHGTVATGGPKIVKVCGAPGLTQLLPFVLVIAVLLAPDLSELAIPGLLSIRRRLGEQDARQDRLETELVRVEHRVEQNQTQSASAKIELMLASERLDQVGDVLVVQAKPEPPPPSEPEQTPGEEDESGGAPTDRPPEGDGGGGGVGGASAPTEEGDEEKLGAWAIEAGTKDREPLTLQLLYLAKNIEQYATISRMREVDPRERMAALTEEQQEVVDRWYVVFRKEIELVLRVRNELAHRPIGIGIEELREADRVGRKLLRVLLNGLGLSTEPIDRFEEG